MTGAKQREHYIRTCMTPEQRRAYQRHLQAQQREQQQQQQQYQQQHRRVAYDDDGQPSSSRAAAQQTSQLIMPRPAAGLPIPARLLAPAAPVLSPHNALASDLDHRPGHRLLPEVQMSPAARSAPRPFPPERRAWEHWPVI